MLQKLHLSNQSVCLVAGGTKAIVRGLLEFCDPQHGNGPFTYLFSWLEVLTILEVLLSLPNFYDFRRPEAEGE